MIPRESEVPLAESSSSGRKPADLLLLVVRKILDGG